MTSHALSGVSCLVLGGGGFIGVNLCRALVSGGARVEAFGRSLPFPDALSGVAWTSGSFSDHEAIARAVEGNEYVFHLIGGGVPESSNKDPAADLSVSVLNTLSLLDLCRRNSVKRVVFLSSGGTVYGIPTSTPIPETAPTDPVSAYGISKLATEKYLGLFRHLHSLDYVVLRAANAYGPYQTAHRKQGVIASIVHNALAGEPVEIWGTGEVVRDFIHVDDVISAMVAAVSYQGSHRVFNVGSGVGFSINQIVADVERVLDRGILERRYKPGRPADVPVNVLDTTLIMREMGWSPGTGWMKGLRETIEWFEAEFPPARLGERRPTPAGPR
jgi:UDP-glucose 4-epimerase